MILLRCSGVVWGLLMIAAVAVTLTSPALIHLPQRGTLLGEAIAIALIFSVFLFPPISLVVGVRTLRHDVLWRSLAIAIMASTLLFAINPGNRALFLNDVLAAIGGVTFGIYVGGSAALAIMAGWQPKKLVRAS